MNDSLPGLASIPSNETVPVFRMLPTTFTTTLIVTVKVAPLARLGTVQVTVPPRALTGGAVQAPAVVVTDVNCKLLGSTSLNTTFGASAPLLLMTHVYVSAVLTFALPRAALPVIARSVVTPVFEGGGGGSAVVTLALLLTNAVPAVSVPLTEAELVMVWFCICTITLTRATAPGASVPALQVTVNTPAPPLVHDIGPLAATIFTSGCIVAVPDTLFATTPA